MLHHVLKSKIHRATVTDEHLHYIGSISIDQALMDAAGIILNERVLVTNLNMGTRFETYAIPAPHNSGKICLNGPTARLGLPGDIVVIMAFGIVSDDEKVEPKVVFVDSKNRITKAAISED
ncbi:MAG: aspartate 1-decarboxylase [Candidatus Micrarchaeota archaeon]